jgi:hypothetical protein
MIELVVGWRRGNAQVPANTSRPVNANVTHRSTGLLGVHQGRLLAFALSAVVLALLFLSGRAFARPVECNPPNTPDMQASHLKGTTAAKACAIGHAYVRANDPPDTNTMYHCGPREGQATLLRHSFAGYHLALVASYGLKFSRGQVSFGLNGQSPIYCG